MKDYRVRCDAPELALELAVDPAAAEGVVVAPLPERLPLLLPPPLLDGKSGAFNGNARIKYTKKKIKVATREV